MQEVVAPGSAKKSVRFLKDRASIKRIDDMSLHLPRTDELRVVIKKKGFRVKTLAVHVGLDVRTLERRFSEQFHTTPKAWITQERMNFAPPLLAGGLSNKQVAASLSYSCESNFCRDFKRYFGCAPQTFARVLKVGAIESCFDKELSYSDKGAALPSQSTARILGPCSPSNPQDSRARCKATESRA